MPQRLSGGAAPIYYIGEGGEGLIFDNNNDPITQNSFDCLAENVGLVAGGNSSFQCFSDEIIRRLTEFSTRNTLSIPLYDVRIGILSGQDAFPNFVDLGTVLPGDELEFAFEFGLMKELFLMASTVEGGEYNVFSYDDILGPDSIFLDISSISVDILNNGGVFDIPILLSDGGDPRVLGSFAVRQVGGASVPEPTAILLFATGVSLLLVKRKRSYGLSNASLGLTGP